MGFLLLLLVAAAATAPAADAWGKEGHYMVCKIAEVIDSRGTTLLTWIHHLALTGTIKAYVQGRRRGKLGLQVAMILCTEL